MLSEKQLALFEAELPRITIVEGAISSGKTFISNHKAIRHITERYAGHGLVMFVGKTLTTLQRNVLEPLANSYPGDFEYSFTSKSASFCGIPIELESCNDAQAEHKIRGATAEFIYGDELTLWNPEFMARCMGSLRTPGAVFLGTTNPDAPTNFLKTGYLDRAAELSLWNPKFTMADNPSLSEGYVRQVSREYTGVLHDRFIKGLWVRAEGLIYPAFSNAPERFLVERPPKDIVVVNIGVDFGGSGSASVFSAVGFTSGFSAAYVLAEEFRPAATEDPESLSLAFTQFCRRIKARWPMCADAYCDSAEQILIRGFRTALAREGIGIRVKNAKKGSINDRIRLVSGLMGQGRFFVTRDCAHTIGALSEAVWDQKREGDVRLDDGSYEVDALDAMEYAMESLATRITMGLR